MQPMSHQKVVAKKGEASPIVSLLLWNVICSSVELYHPTEKRELGYDEKVEEGFPLPLFSLQLLMLE